MKQKFEIKNLGVKDKFLNVLKQKLWNEEIKEYLIQRNRKINLVCVLTNNKLVLFESDNETYGKAFSYKYSEVKKIKKINETKTKSDLLIDFEDNKLFSFEFLNIIDVDSFIDFFNLKNKAQNLKPQNTKNLILEKMEKAKHFSNKELFKTNLNSNNLSQSKNENNFTKDKSELKSNLPKIYVDQPQQFHFEKNSHSHIRENKIINIIDDKNIFDNKTFSSRYIIDLLTKKNTILPNGSLSLIEKLDNKLSILELAFSKPGSNFDLSEAIDFGIEFSKLKKRVNDIEKNNYDDEIINLKVFTKKEIQAFAENFSNKLSDFSHEIRKSQGSENIFSKINQLKNLFFEEISKIQNIATDDRKFLEKTAVNQKTLVAEIDKMKNKISDSRQQILDVQKAWLVTKEKIDNFNQNNNEDLNINLLNEIDEKINALSSNINFKNIFQNTVFNVKNKILAIDEKGNGTYFNIENFKDDIIDIIQKNETLIYSDIENKIDKVQLVTDKVFNNTLERFETIKNWYEEIKDFKNTAEKIELNQNLISSQQNEENSSNKTKIFYFKALSYSYKNELRYGIRSGMKWSINDSEDGRRGINSLYVDNNGKQLNLNDYDGIIFNNQKYYFNIPNEFNDNFFPQCKFQSVKYNLDLNKIDKIFSFDISKDAFIYTVKKENQEIIDDRFSESALYDLKWLTFFKD